MSSNVNKGYNGDEQNLMNQGQSFIDLVWTKYRNISTCFIMKIMGLMKKIIPLSFFAWFKWVSVWVREAYYCLKFVDLQKPTRSSEICMRNPSVLLMIWCAQTSPFVLFCLILIENPNSHLGSSEIVHEKSQVWELWSY